MLKKLFLFLMIVSLSACESIYSTSSDRVARKDTGRALITDLGTIIDVVPVKIKGDPSVVGALAGGIVGGIASQTVGSGTGKDIAIVAGTVAGGVVGYFSTVKLGEHNGFQYTIKIDDRKQPLSIIQGESKEKSNNHNVGDRVTIIYGNQKLDDCPKS
jgi:outer membrane lipoprotein SlyB